MPFTTAAALVNDVAEAKQQLRLNRALRRRSRHELIAIDEVGEVSPAEVGEEPPVRGHRRSRREGGVDPGGRRGIGPFPRVSAKTRKVAKYRSF